jgi:hypothetical protein
MKKTVLFFAIIMIASASLFAQSKRISAAAGDTIIISGRTATVVKPLPPGKRYNAKRAHRSNKIHEPSFTTPVSYPVRQIVLVDSSKYAARYTDRLADVQTRYTNSILGIACVGVMVVLVLVSLLVLYLMHDRGTVRYRDVPLQPAAGGNTFHITGGSVSGVSAHGGNPIAVKKNKEILKETYVILPEEPVAEKPVDAPTVSETTVHS